MRIVLSGACWLVTALLAAALIGQPVSVNAQQTLALLALGLAFTIYLLRLRGGWRFVFLALASAIVLRYAYWRTTATLPDPDDIVNFIPAMILYFAEMYYIVLLGMNLFVVADPLERPQAPEVSDDRLPTVDVFVPSYNESREILALTLASAKSMDYPAEKLAIYLLDDGGTDEKRSSRDPRVANAALRRHEELKQLCADLGVNYLTRTANVRAKAGNLNSGLANSDSELVVVFDADHAPAREFLRETVSYFCADRRLFLVQTPHFFSNPDPLEKNLSTFEKMPSENEMFYGTIQKGLDKWNAAFFCGSAAVLRRKALDEVGGFSGLTITEDCETALDLHSRGWNSVYVDRPMITGLQPETFTSFIGQRSRWCRGMIQIFLMKNAALRKGLSLPQKICYLSSSISWFYPFVRLTFLVAPLLFIFFNLKIYDVSPQEFVAYTLTYLAAGALIRNYIYGTVRWPWVSELYEYVQSVYLFRAIVSVLINPRRPTFNVTAKGETLAEDRLSELALPYFVIFAVLLSAAIYGAYRYQSEPEVAGILVVVGIWNLINLLFAGAALGVVTERRERRQAPRIACSRGAKLLLNGLVVPVIVQDISMTGSKALPLTALPDLRGTTRAELMVTSADGERDMGFLPVRVQHIVAEGEHPSLGLSYEAGARHYELIAELMLGDMRAVREQRLARRRRRLVTSTMSFLAWAVTGPFRGFYQLAFNRGPSATAEPAVTLPAPAGSV